MISASLSPYLTLPYLTLPYLTLPYLTLPYLTLLDFHITNVIYLFIFLIQSFMDRFSYD